MADKLMYIPNYDTQNYLNFRLKLVVGMFKYFTKWTNQSKFDKSPQVVRATNKKTLLKDFGD